MRVARLFTLPTEKTCHMFRNNSEPTPTPSTGATPELLASEPVRWMVAAMLVASCNLLPAVPSAYAGRGDCGQPQSTGSSPMATDSLVTLRTAVGLADCGLDVCDVNATCTINVTDALLLLQTSTGQSTSLSCTCPDIDPPAVCETFATKWGVKSPPVVAPDLPPPGTYNRPRGVAINDTGDVYIVDAASNRVQVTNTDGVFIIQFGSRGQGAGEMDRPRSAAVAPDGFVWITDRSNHRIQKFGAAGGGLQQIGALGVGPGQFNLPQGIAIAPNGDIYVSDSGNNRIQKFDSAGNFISTWGSLGAAPGQFNSPRGIATDGVKVWVADSNNSRVQVFDTNGAFIDTWGALGSLLGNFRDPRGLAIDRYKRVYVSERTNHRVQVFTGDGTFITSIGGFGIGDGQFNGPRDVAVDSLGRVFVSDTENDRIQRFDCN